MPSHKCSTWNILSFLMIFGVLLRVRFGVPPPSATLTPPPHCGGEGIAVAARRLLPPDGGGAAKRSRRCGASTFAAGAANIIRSSEAVWNITMCDFCYSVRRPCACGVGGQPPNPARALPLTRWGSAPYSIEFTRLSTSSQTFFEEKSLTKNLFGFCSSYEFTSIGFSTLSMLFLSFISILYSYVFPSPPTFASVVSVKYNSSSPLK